jgi:hypothetical protein
MLEKFLATVCAILFIIGGVLTLFLFNIESKAFSSTTYKQAFADQRLYERMPGLLAATLHTFIAQNPDAYPFLKELSVEDWQSTISSVLPPEELRTVADGALDSTFDYMNRRTDSVVISLLPIKAQLAGQAGINVIRQFLTTQPDCTFEQLTQMGLGILGGNIALCNPPAEAMGLFAPFIESQLQTINAAFPGELTLVPGTGLGTADDPRLRLHMVRSAIRLSPFFLILLLLAILVFGVRSLRDWLVWWGWPLLITGAVSTVLALIGSPIVGWLLRFLIQTQGALFLPPLLASSLAETASAVASQMLVPVALQGFVISTIGLGLVILSILIPRRTVYTSL